MSAKKSLNSFTPSRAMGSQKLNYVNEIYGSYHLSQNMEVVELVEKFPEIKTFNELINHNSCLRRLYELVRECQQNHSYVDAIFYADKLLTLMSGQIVACYILGECYFYNQDYKKVHSLFVKYSLLNYNINFQVLSARACLKNKQYHLCLNILELQLEKQYSNPQLEAQKFLLKAQCYESSENKLSAIPFYVECLKKDPTCNEAFMRLTDCYLLSNTEKDRLLVQLNIAQEDAWIKQFYRERIRDDFLNDKKSLVSSKSKQIIWIIHIDLFYIIEYYNFSSTTIRILFFFQGGILPTSLSFEKKGITSSPILLDSANQAEKSGIEIEQTPKTYRPEKLFEILNQKNNIDFLCIKAKNAYAKYDIHKAYEICVKAVKQDPLYFDIIPIYCTCLLDLNYLGELYYCAHVIRIFFFSPSLLPII